MKDQSIIKPIFIVGCGRSGTTLLFYIFKKHPHLTGTTGYPDGEDHLGWIEHGNCLISGLGERPTIDGGHTGFHYCLHMNEQDVTAEIIDNMTSYYRDDVLSGNGSKRVLNKNPHLSNKLRYVRGIFPDAKFVHIIRDCLPVVSSWIQVMEHAQPHQVLYFPQTEYPCHWILPAPRNRARRAIFEKEDRMYPGGGAAMLVDFWATVNRNIPLQLWDSPQQLLTVKYEDLAVNSLETLNRICEFCEIPSFTDVPLQIDPACNEKYKKHLTEGQIVDFLQRSCATRTLFGYLQGPTKERRDSQALGGNRDQRCLQLQLDSSISRRQNAAML
jgi:hypothetical protein